MEFRVPPHDRVEVLEPSGHFSWYLHDLAKAIHEQGLAMRPDGVRGPLAKPLGHVARLMSRSGLFANLTRREPTLIALGGNRGLSEWIPALLTHELVPILTDCWPPYYAYWERALRKCRVRLALVSARQSAEHLTRAVPGLTALWHPESIDPGRYHPERPIAERSIDLLEFGRSYAPFHESARPAMERAGRSHKYPDLTQHVHKQFADPADLRRAMGDAKLMTCYPASITHPERAEGVETMTLRYLEAFASGAVPIGRMPREVVDLFGYNPGIDIAEGRDPGEAVIEALSDEGRLHELAQRNLARLGEVGTCEVRARETLERLQEHGWLSSRA